jgi:hypothetical protein
MQRKFGRCREISVIAMPDLYLMLVLVSEFDHLVALSGHAQYFVLIRLFESNDKVVLSLLLRLLQKVVVV